MDDLVRFYKDKRVLVTGHTGFKGSWLTLWLTEMGAQVTGFSLPDESNGIWDNDYFSKKVKDIRGNLSNYSHISDAIDKSQADIIFQLAAQPLVSKSYLYPRDTFRTNIDGAINLLSCLEFHDTPKAIVFITSDKAYRNKEWYWGYRETDELGGEDPYSTSKACAELLVHCYSKMYPEMGIVTTRAGNVIGGGDFSEDRIIPDTIRALQRNEPIIIRNPTATRPWQHVLEPLYGYLLLGKKTYEERTRGAFNFGPGSSSFHTVEDVVKSVINIWGEGSYKFRPNHMHEHKLLHLCSDKAYQELGWKAKWDFETTVRMTIEWYKNVTKLQNTSAIEMAKSQLRAYYENLDNGK